MFILRIVICFVVLKGLQIQQVWMRAKGKKHTKPPNNDHVTIAIYITIKIMILPYYVIWHRGINWPLVRIEQSEQMDNFLVFSAYIKKGFFKKVQIFCIKVLWYWPWDQEGRPLPIVLVVLLQVNGQQSYCVYVYLCAPKPRPKIVLEVMTVRYADRITGGKTCKMWE